MGLYYIKHSKLTNNNNNIKIKCKISRNIILNFHRNGCGFKRFETINKEELSDLFKSLN